jgi:hypothetical protein
MMFGQSEVKDSESFHAIVSAHIYIDENGKKDIEIFDFIHDDDKGTDIFCDIEYTLLDFIDIGDKEEHFFMAHVRSWFHSYYDYFDGYQAEVEAEVQELKSIKDFAELKLGGN